MSMSTCRTFITTTCVALYTVELYIECVASWNNGNDAFFVARILSSSQFRSRDVRYRCYVSYKYTVIVCYLIVSDITVPSHCQQQQWTHTTAVCLNRRRRVDWKCRTGKWRINEGPNGSNTDRHDWKMRDHISRVGKCRIGKCETGKCRTENAALENAGPKMHGWKMQDRKMWDQFYIVIWMERTQICAVHCCITFILSSAGVLIILSLL